MKIGVIGDTHANLQFLRWALKSLKEQGCTQAVIDGDFGFVWKRPSGYPVSLTATEIPKGEWAAKVYRSLNPIEQAARYYGIDVAILLGNHDNYDAWELAGFPTRFPVPIPVEGSKRLTYLPRGARWEWGGLRFLSMGGAVSIDKHHRTDGIDWWPQELITDADVEACGTDPVDVLLSHDSPPNPQLQRFLDEWNDFGITYKMDALSQNSRWFMGQIADAVTPKLVVHGHYHHRYTWAEDDRVVVGLNRDGSGDDALYVIDSDSPRWSRKEGT